LGIEAARQLIADGAGNLIGQTRVRTDLS
jgi:hypothetical protein